MSVHQKLGMILENKVVQKLSLEKNVFNKKWSPKLIFSNEKKSFKKFCRFLTSKIDFESTILALFDELSFIDRIFYFFSFEHVDSSSKILLFRTHRLRNSTTELILQDIHDF